MRLSAPSGRARGLCALPLVLVLACGGREANTRAAMTEPSADAAAPDAASGGDAGAAADGSQRPAAGSGGSRSAAAGSGSAGSGGPRSAAGSGGTRSAAGGGQAGTSTTAAPGTLLDQTGNPILSQLTRYERWLSSAGTPDAQLSADRKRADNMLSWQLPHGGFFKNAVEVYDAAWDGKASRAGWTGDKGVELGTIDNGATGCCFSQTCISAPRALTTATACAKPSTFS